MKLPGGVLIDEPLAGDRRCAAESNMDASCHASMNREFSFVADTGALDVTLQDSLQYSRENGISHPAWVSRVLTQVLAKLAGKDIGCDQNGLDRVRDLCVADRQFIVLHWRIRHETVLQWITAQCGQCNACYDFPLDWRGLPIKPAAPLFPYAMAQTTQGELLLRVPNGWDQEWLAGASTRIDESNDLKRQLALRLIVRKHDDVSGKGLSTDLLTDEDIGAIEEAVEKVVPELPDQLNTTCPECGANQFVHLNIYDSLVKPVGELLDDVHRLAVNYHWSEAEILKMPKHRRKQYLSRLDRDRGLRGAPA